MAGTINVGTLEAVLRLKDEMSSTLKVASTNLIGAGKSMEAAGRSLLPLSAAMLAAGGASLVMSSNFNASMQKLVGLAGVSQTELAGVKEGVLALAGATGIGPQALAEGMMVVSSTVSDTGVAMAILTTAAQASAAGMGETTDVARALTAVINAYGPSQISAAQAGDILTQTVKDGGAEARELAPALGAVIPLAAQLGISFMEVGANIATYTKLGVPAAEATTALRSVMTSLVNPTKEQGDALKSVGMDLAGLRAEIKERGLGAALIDLKQKFGENTEGLAQVTGRVEGFMNILGTAGAQAETYAAEVVRMNEAYASGGQLLAAFGEMQKTQAQTFAELSAQVQVLAIRIGDALAPAFSSLLVAAQPIITWLISAVQWFTTLPNFVQTGVIAFLAFIAVLGPLLIAAGAVTTAIGTLTGILGFNTAAAITATAAEAAFIGPMLPGTTIAGSFAAAIGSINIAMAAGVLGVLAIGVAVFKLTEYWAANTEAGKATVAMLADVIEKNQEISNIDLAKGIMVTPDVAAFAVWWGNHTKAVYAAKVAHDALKPAIAATNAVVAASAPLTTASMLATIQASKNVDILKQANEGLGLTGKATALTIKDLATAKQFLALQASQSGKAVKDLTADIEKLNGVAGRKEMAELAMQVKAVGGLAGVSKAAMGDLADKVDKLVAAGVPLATIFLELPKGPAEAAKELEYMLADEKQAKAEADLIVKLLNEQMVKGFEKAATEADRVRDAVVQQIPPLQQAIGQAIVMKYEIANRLKMEYEVLKVLFAQGRASAEDLAVAKAAAEAAAKAAQGGIQAQQTLGQWLKKNVDGLRGIANGLLDLNDALGGSSTSFLAFGAAGLGVLANLNDAELQAKSNAEKIGMALSAAANIWAANSKNLSGASGAMSGAMAGAQAGAAFGPWGAAIGGLAGGLIGFFSGSKFRRIAKDAGRVLGEELSQEMVERIQQTMEDMDVGVEVASLLNLAPAMEESSRAASAFAPQIMQLIAGIANGTIPAKEGIEQLGGAWGLVAAEASAAGLSGSAAMVAIIQATRAAGIQMPAEMQQYVNEAIDKAIAGMNRFAEGLVGLEDASRFSGEASANMFMGTFAMAIEKDGLFAAINSLMPAFENLKTVFEAQGNEAALALLAPFSRLAEIFGEGGPLAGMGDVMQGLDDMLKGLADSGMLTAESFSNIQTQIVASSLAMQDAGVVDADRLMALMPMLSDAVNASREYGFTLDDQTAALVAQAEAAGYAFPTDPMLVMVDLLGQIVVLMGGELPAAATAASTAITAASTATQAGLTEAGAAALAATTAVADAATAAAGASLSAWDEAASATEIAIQAAMDASVEAEQAAADAAVAAADQAALGFTDGASAILDSMEAAMAGSAAAVDPMLAAVGGAVEQMNQMKVTIPISYKTDGAAPFPGGADDNPDTPWPMARGGIVEATPGGSHILAGEAGQDELVAPVQALVKSIVSQIADVIAQGQGGMVGHVYLDGQDQRNSYVRWKKAGLVE